ncbi:MAG: PIN domain-containing protein [Gemmataceae bacterium]|nr:PIN domain-containing protein [Gemmataceae bacterium]MCI0737618.1 PIN domain-containing protein [Gemmataceae bacterium]
MLPKKLREWFTGPGGGPFSTPTNAFLWTLRAVFIALTIGVATSALLYFDRRNEIVEGVASFATFLILGVVIIVVDVFTRNKQITTISSVYFGLLMGFFLGQLFWMALEPIFRGYLHPSITDFVRLFIIVVMCYISVSVLVQTKDEFRFIIPYVEFSKQIKGAKPLVLDTSVIIDGRIADICDTGVIDTKMIVPRFVLQELQAIADSSDKIKRNRGRRGLDILKRMQSNTKVELHMHEGNLAELRDVHKVDERLVVLANVLSARVVTNDFNLNKIAQLQGVEVINLNELANALKLVALPGENLNLRIVKQGDQIGQGVGYLDDGTMVVVEQGRSAIGQEVSITVTSVLQTPAGRMIFGKIDSGDTSVRRQEDRVSR